MVVSHWSDVLALLLSVTNAESNDRKLLVHDLYRLLWPGISCPPSSLFPLQVGES